MACRDEGDRDADKDAVREELVGDAVKGVRKRDSRKAQRPDDPAHDDPPQDAISESRHDRVPQKSRESRRHDHVGGHHAGHDSEMDGDTDCGPAGTRGWRVPDVDAGDALETAHWRPAGASGPTASAHYL